MDFQMFEQRGLIRVADVSSAGEDSRVLREAAARGELQRVRRGVYCTAERWAMSSGRTRHLLAARAALLVRRDGVLAGRTAATAWGLPLGAVHPEVVTLLVPGPTGGTRGGVRVISLGAARAEVVTIDGMPVTTCARTAADVARRAGFTDAVMMIDAARSRRAGSRASLTLLTTELDLARAGGERLTSGLARALAFSTELSDSPGESLTRVAIHRAGFAPPVLQHEFRDMDGVMAVDFWWPDVRVAVEFDGKVKYTRQEYTTGDPSQVVWREKKREDRLRRLVHRVERVVWSDVREPSRLRRILTDAGVPMRAR